MPLVRAQAKLIYYAHVPKCAGSAVEYYLRDRFGPLALWNTRYNALADPWTRTSPQHIDRASLATLLPDSFIDHSFCVVRHPVSRIVSAWHFQKDVEGTVPDGTGFSDWLQSLPAQWADSPYAFDNHTRPMDDFVPRGAKVFYLEHGLEALIPWLDTVTGTASTPRFIDQVNTHSKNADRNKAASAGAKLQPDPDQLALIARLYQADFSRFGYAIDAKMPLAPPPPSDPAEIARQEAARTRAARPLGRFLAKLRRRLSRI